MNIINEIHSIRIQNLCEKYNVEKLFLFGSAVTGSLKKDSDIDFLVRFKRGELSSYFENYMALKENLKLLFNRRIDLVEEQSLRNPIFINSINKQKELIYG
ncbi:MULTISPECIES: nucleotidyltransferase family protein [Flammeovirga]|uniref:Nucleotidyltransferase domain-containing protein n=2 Tax=Flammeovirga TaxID=59739 RepID=A0A3S9P049_9BACT|nr:MULTISPECIES: nucleotidyltransferase domain-containing protein [Flammeovirga]AZQ61561.1 nucleotidyltransferase domain-containing protein [Flammeovirga pectinis]MBB6458883.1 hypothetical protein [Flammeovirga kamogawensis]QWG08464.1 nucleotidyltransferase domain-containing protein [Flammeovirga kamogawensis]TRX66760.1 nucleotidyltransferase domain-containing protein [Flammeovirga kamogawensis]